MQYGSTFFCVRCETNQKRGEQHWCVATEKYRKAKAEGRVVYSENGVDVSTSKALEMSQESRELKTKPSEALEMPRESRAPKIEVSEIANKNAPKHRAETLEAANTPGIANRIEAVSTSPANISELANTDRKAYMRELMRKKRADAKGTTHSTVPAHPEVERL